MGTIAYHSDNWSTGEVRGKSSPAPKKILLGSLDFLMLNVAFWGVHCIKYQNLSLSPIHKELLIVFWALWFVILLLSKKLCVIQRESLWNGCRIITKSNGIFIMVLSLAIVGLRMTAASRIQAYGSCLLFYGLEITSYIVFRSWHIRDLHLEAVPKSVKATRGKASFALFTIGGVLLFVSLSVSLYFKHRTILIGDQYLDFVLMLYGLWMVSAILTNKYAKENFQHLNVWLPASIKSTILMIGAVAILVFGTRFFNVTYLLIFGPILIYFLLESIVFYMCFLFLKHGGNIHDLEDFRDIGKILEKESDTLQCETQSMQSVVDDPVEVKLKTALEFLNPSLFQFIRENIDLTRIDRKESVLLSTDDLFNVKSLDNEKIRLFINLQKLNDMRWFNQYFLAVHIRLVRNGYLIGHAHTIETQRGYFREKYTLYIGPFLYLMHFVWNRVIPKLPWAQKVYFAVTKGRNRTVSTAEIFGRLYFCGFRVIAEAVMDNRLYFIAQKVKPPSPDRNPTYGPFIHLKRFGSENHQITVYKFRTMYPYSEYLQEYMYEKNRLEKGGKFKEDFRVTSWGKFLRKTWLDELPMLYNWIKGDLQLFGVRPLSKQYFGLYSDDLRALRTQVKPGLIPPFYADLPKTLDQILESERRYIEAYLKHPLSTQYRYLSKCFLNIVIRRARSA